ncbi:MAG: hypothetical protein CL760_01000 [Chloroflexi bacterium]|nr:hypothetical protein [Chloroflexota bacterium]
MKKKELLSKLYSEAKQRVIDNPESVTFDNVIKTKLFFLHFLKTLEETKKSNNLAIEDIKDFLKDFKGLCESYLVIEESQSTLHYIIKKTYAKRSNNYLQNDSLSEDELKNINYGFNLKRLLGEKLDKVETFTYSYPVEYFFSDLEEKKTLKEMCSFYPDTKENKEHFFQKIEKQQEDNLGLGQHFGLFAKKKDVSHYIERNIIKRLFVGINKQELKERVVFKMHNQKEADEILLQPEILPIFKYMDYFTLPKREDYNVYIPNKDFILTGLHSALINGNKDITFDYLKKIYYSSEYNELTYDELVVKTIIDLSTIKDLNLYTGLTEQDLIELLFNESKNIKFICFNQETKELKEVECNSYNEFNEKYSECIICDDLFKASFLSELDFKSLIDKMPERYIDLTIRGNLNISSIRVKSDKEFYKFFLNDSDFEILELSNLDIGNKEFEMLRHKETTVHINSLKEFLKKNGMTVDIKKLLTNSFKDIIPN